jgi:predicted DNA-binding ribbon-helix-helix protein
VKASRLTSRNMSVNGTRTSVRLEPEFWVELREAADKRNISVADLVTQINQENPASQLGSAIRVWFLQEGKTE